jgi:hypothetical protein
MEDAENQMRPVTNKTLDKLLKFREELMQETNGRLFEDSVKFLRKDRIKRTKYLMEAATGKPFKLDDEDLAEMDEDDLKDIAEDEI